MTQPASPSASSKPLVPTKNYLMWFRRDLRIHDNTALTQLTDLAKRHMRHMRHMHSDSQCAAHIKAIYVTTPKQWLEHNMSFVQMDFIFRTLKVLADSLFYNLGIELTILEADRFDDSITTICSFCHTHHISHVFSNYEYEINEKTRDDALEQSLHTQNIIFTRYHDQCILPPKTVTTNNNSMYQIFTPFYKQWQHLLDIQPPNEYQAEPINIAIQNHSRLNAIHEHINLAYHNSLRLFERAYPNKTKNNRQLNATQTSYPAGEIYARHRLQQFIAQDINTYDISRDQPSLSTTSHLSAYLAIGSISPRHCYLQAKQALLTTNSNKADIQLWISELAWRDFYRHIIVYRPDIVKGNAYHTKTDKKINWSYHQEDFKKWCEGNTGIPLVDAAMRCLNETGFMHNRLRMVTAMFLTKDLLIDWRWGEKYFLQNLIDADFASNNGGWQWSASVGTDAAPYFRIMNPFSQAKTHDKEAIFIKTWIPQLQSIAPKILHDEAKLAHALSQNDDLFAIEYPVPMVNHKQARLTAIAAYKANDNSKKL